MLLQSGLVAPNLSPPPPPPPSGPLPLPLPHISTFQHPDTVAAGTRFHSMALAVGAASPASHDAVGPGLPHPRMLFMLKSVQLHHMALIRQGSHACWGFMCIKGGNDVQELFFLAGLADTKEHYSRVIGLLCKCERSHQSFIQQLGREKVRESQAATNGERKQSPGLGRRVPEIRCSPGAEIGVSIFVLWFLTAARRGRRSRLP